MASNTPAGETSASSDDQRSPLKQHCPFCDEWVYLSTHVSECPEATDD